ncbi:hypothetical protein FHG64_13705 [Antarcticibacterium flavum]|uniref:Carboxypeptidase-like regulatory domain-containing protein n=1 Tax=Antarcticibacterium flavum TaxID=2058175 RepID=A0A5B7X4K2_9FLAO|nr:MULTISPECIES: hypothetical protein [Antarcticibacterium]MCM4160038.1 hypothetical protein [Antarcticibacterium sp. W02-3]QCY70376.1 hypothetical protein FHG64_13705 [Antarcticibacterium flavum]
MKRVLIIVLLLFVSNSLLAQEKERKRVVGTLQMPAEEEVQGVSIYNLNTNAGTVSNDNGQFRIEVGLNDSIRISAIQFQEFTVIVNEGVMESGQLNINITEVVNQLPEVIVSPFDLTGNVNVDVARIRVVQTPDTLTSREAQFMYFESDAEPRYTSPRRNEAMEMSRTRLVNGLNFVNLFKELLLVSKRDHIQNPESRQSWDVRELYSDEFFKQNLNIKEENIPDFIFYADANGLDEKMLQKGNELDLIEFLIEQSKKYKKQQARN